MKQSLIKTVDKEGFNKYVKFYGELQYEQVPEAYKTADIYVIPSLFEGTPKSLLEAMYNGLPVIGSDTNGIKNIIKDGENGLLFKVSNDRELTIKLKQIIENKELREKLGDNAITHVKNNYNYKTTLSEFIDVYENIKK
jgi:glycosyltransferase involved in cell wall biosynthesis